MMNDQGLEQSKVVGFRRPPEFYAQSARRLMQSGQAPSAVANARKALKMQPENAAYKLLLAEALIQVRWLEAAMQLLFEVIDSGHSGSEFSESFYYLGCIFLLLNDLDRAGDSFETYLDLAPDSPRAARLEMILESFNDVIESQSSVLTDAALWSAMERVRQARAHLECEDWAGALAILDDVPESKKDLGPVRCCRARAEFESGREDLAVALVEDVLSSAPDNTEALSNMAHFLIKTERREEARPYLERMTAQPLKSIDTFAEVVSTLLELNEHELVYRYMREHHEQTMEVQGWFYEAVAAYNTGRFKEAIHILSELRKIDSSDLIPESCLRRVHQADEAGGAAEPIPYAFDLPLEEAKARDFYLGQCMSLSTEKRKELWENDDEFVRSMRWAMHHCDSGSQSEVCRIVAGFGGQKAERLLREYLLLPTRSGTAKNDVIRYLTDMGAKRPYQAFLGSVLIEITDEGPRSLVPTAKARMKDALNLVDAYAKKLGTEGLIAPASRLLKSVNGAMHLRNVWAFPQDAAAAALWEAASGSPEPVSLGEIARVSGAEPENIRSAAREMKKEVQKNRQYAALAGEGSEQKP